MGTSIFDILKLVSQLQTAGPFEKMFDNQVAQDFGINLPPGPSVDISMEKQVRQPVMPTNVTPEPPGLANIAASILQRQPQNFPAQSAPQAAPQQPQGPDIASLLPLIAGAGELFNPFAARGGPVSVGSKVNDAVRAMLGTQQGLSQINLMNARAGSQRVGNIKINKIPHIKDGVRGQIVRETNTVTGETKETFVPDKNRIVPFSTNTEAGFAEIGPDNNIVKTRTLAQKGMTPANQKKAEEARNRLLNNIDRLTVLRDQITDPSKKQALGGLLGFGNRVKEFIGTTFLGEPLDEESATKFNVELQTVIAQSAAELLQQPGSKISDKDLKRLDKIISNIPTQSEAEVAIQINNAINILQKAALADGVQGAVDVSRLATNTTGIFRDVLSGGRQQAGPQIGGGNLQDLSDDDFRNMLNSRIP